MSAKKPKLTKWFDGSKFVPFHVGEYNASPIGSNEIFRWWNGSNWSLGYYQTESDIRKKAYMETPAILFGDDAIFWRGLAQNPKVKKCS